MMFTRPMLTEHSLMFGRRIARMFIKSILRKFFMELFHHTITRYLSNHTRCGNTQRQSITPNKSCLRQGEPSHRQSINEGMRWLYLQSFNCASHGKMCRTQNIKISNLFNTSLSQSPADFWMVCNDDKQFFPNTRS